jgi:hypothetical protein
MVDVLSMIAVPFEVMVIEYEVLLGVACGPGELWFGCRCRCVGIACASKKVKVSGCRCIAVPQYKCT